MAGLSWHRAELIAQKMRNLICVAQVSVEPLAASRMPLQQAR